MKEYFNWTPEHDAKLRTWRDEGVSAKDIAERLGDGFTGGMVSGRIYRAIRGRGRYTKRPDGTPAPLEIDDKYLDDSSCRIFWLAVITRHTKDAAGDFGGTVDPNQREIATARARQWLESNQLDYACELADVDVDRMFAAIAVKLKAGPTPLA